MIGTPTYHRDITIEMKNLFEDAASKSITMKNKIAAAFSSYGWSGEAPRLALEIMKNKFGADVNDPSASSQIHARPSDTAKMQRTRKEDCRKTYSSNPVRF